MVFIGYLLVTTLGVSNMVNAAPLAIGRRSTTDAAQAWMQKCLASGEGERCIEVHNKASKALLATAGVCDQQNVADEMIDLAKSLHHNNAELITLAQEYAHASHATSGSCTTPPKHSELTSTSTSTSKSSKTVAAKAKTGHNKTSKSMHKSISAKEDGEEEEEGTPEGEEGQTNQLPGTNTPTTQAPNNSTNTTAPTTQPTTPTPINIVVNSANPPPTDPNNNGTQVPPHTANMSPQANYTSQVLSINQALAAATQSLSSAGNSLASALSVIAQAINNINSATQGLLPGLNITTTTPPLVANLAQTNSTNSTVPCPDPNNPGTKNGTTTDGNTPPADTGNGSTPPPEGQQQDQSQGKGKAN